MHEPTDSAYELGFRSLGEDAEVTDRELPVEGTIPEWLSGALIRNGPGRFEFGGERATHWFDGLAMIRRYGFEDGTLRYTNRFLRTDAYKNADRADRPGEFATGGGSLRTIARWIRSLGPPEPTDNANVHVAQFGDHHVALTEAPRRIAFDPETAETIGEFRWRDDIAEHMTTAHVRRNPLREETIGYSTTFGRPHQYHLYAIPDGTAAREPIASIRAEGPGYIHDCAVTANHIILVETPLRIAIWRALSPFSGGLFDLLEYDEDTQTRFIVVDRDSGSVVADPQTDPFFVFHHINAFEDGDELVVDLVAFEDDEIVSALSFESLAKDAFAGAPQGRFDRFRITLDDVSVSRSRRYDGGLELPTVPQTVRAQPYRYAYAQATDRRGANGLVKIDANAETATEWWQRGVYVEEPRMVPRPDGTAEDDGVVLAPALDTRTERSILLVFDAASLTELARATLPHVTPFGFHGRFFSSQ